MGERLSSVTAVRAGTILVVVGIALILVITVTQAAPLLAALAWVVAGAGMGLMSPRSSALVLATSSPAEQGFNSGAMTVADSFGSALALAVTGSLFVTLGAVAGVDAFAGVFALAAVIGAAAAVLAPRTRSTEPAAE